MPIIILSAELTTTAALVEQIPPPTLPEIALLGRSNVGKSSLINALTGRKKLAWPSSTPGKTRVLNFYTVRLRLADKTEREIVLVDMPGYGYAKVSKSERQGYDHLAAALLTAERESIVGSALVVDVRHPGKESDLDAWLWLNTLAIPRLAVVTKCDKPRQSDLHRNLKKWENALESTVMPFSAVKRRGTERLWQEFLTWAS